MHPYFRVRCWRKISFLPNFNPMRIHDVLADTTASKPEDIVAYVSLGRRAKSRRETSFRDAMARHTVKNKQAKRVYDRHRDDR